MSKRICLHRFILVLASLLSMHVASYSEEAAWKTAADLPGEGELDAFLSAEHFELTPLFKNERFANIVVATDGTLIATWGTSHVRARRSEDGGSTWGEPITIAKPGFQGGGLTVDERSGDIFMLCRS